MANQAGAAKAKYETSTSAATSSVAEPQNVRSREQLDEEIARRAYELYEESGRADGDDLLHWLLAEEEICGKSANENGAKYASSSQDQTLTSKEQARIR